MRARVRAAGRTSRAGLLEEGGGEEGQGDERQGEQLEQDEVGPEVVVQEEIELERGTEGAQQEHRPRREEDVGDHPGRPVDRVLCVYECVYHVWTT